MVRIKHRYLLINVLYPEQKTRQKATQQVNHQLTKDDPPWMVHFRRPSSDNFDSKMLVRLIRNGISELFGDYGAGMASSNLRIVYLSSATSTAIIRCPRAHYRLVWAALSFTTQLPKPVSEACVIQVVRVSGTIRKAEEEAIRRARAIINRSHKTRSIDIAATAVASGETPSHLPQSSEQGDINMSLNFANGIEDADDSGDDDGYDDYD